MRLAWVTDPHFNFVDDEVFARFCQEVESADPDAILLSGDIAESASVCSWLGRLSAAWQRPIYFVPGNHDFYGSSIAEVRDQVGNLGDPNLVWLNQRAVVPLTAKTALVGHDGWGDGGYGNVGGSPIVLSDFFRICELTGLRREQLRQRLNELGAEAGRHLASHLPTALEEFEHSVILTHVPPWVEACWHEGKFSDKDWTPFFACKAAGDAILSAVDGANPNRRVTVLCGHTHGAGVQEGLRPNLVAYTGGAVYGAPALQRVFEFP